MVILTHTESHYPLHNMHKNSDKPAFPFSDPDTRQGRRLNLDDGRIPRYLCTMTFLWISVIFRGCCSPGVILQRRMGCYIELFLHISPKSLGPTHSLLYYLTGGIQLNYLIGI